jgi:aspartyl protease family protein
MLRMYVIILVLVGIGASLVGRLPQQSSSAPREPITVAGRAAAINSTSTGAGQSVNELDRGFELTRDANGYFYADVQINGAPVHMVVDTGATVIALSRNDAQMAGLATSIGMNDVIGEGADGVVKGEQVTLDRVTLGDKTVEAVPAIVLSNGGQSLLGQSFLSKFASVKIEGDKMVLR